MLQVLELEVGLIGVSQTFHAELVLRDVLKLSRTGCSRYDGSYSNLVAQQLGVDPKDLDFTYTACSGAIIQDVKEQAKALSNGQQYVIVSAVRTTSSIESNVVTYRWE